MSEQSLTQSISRHFDEVVRDPVWGDVQLDAPLAALFRSRPLRFLDGIRQLGPVAQVYPGATHTRRAHSLGVYHLARRMALSLLERGQLPFATETGLRSFLAAALCHDIGHYPYAHSLKELPLLPHESLGAELILEEPLKSLVRACGADPAAAAAIVDPGRRRPEDFESGVYRRFLSGVLDPDKIDYLTRDAFHCGVPYGIQDADYIARRLLVRPGRMAVDGRGAMSVEAVLFSKYQMYRSVYWHPGVRAATAMVKKTLLLGIEAGKFGGEGLYGLDDAGFAAALSGSEAWRRPALEALAGKGYRCAAEFPFDEGKPAHRDLLDLAKRLKAEASLAGAAGLDAPDLVIDLPEPITFETDLLVVEGGEARDFGSRGGLFGGARAADLVLSLRKLRVFVRPDTQAERLVGLAQELLAG